jgi:hypothetical protein
MIELQEGVRFTGPTIVKSGQRVGEILIGTSADAPGLFQTISLGLSSKFRTESSTTGPFEAMVSLAEFGSGLSLAFSDIRGAVDTTLPSKASISLWPSTTAGRIKRNSNRLKIVNAVRVAGLIGAYEAAAAASYGTEDQINETRQRLEEIHEDLMRDDTIDRNIIQSDDDVRSAVEQVRIVSLDIIEQKRQESYGTTNVEINAQTSSFIEAYNLYAEEARNEQQLERFVLNLRRLNPGQKANMFFGDTVVFTRNV